jgi:hypothetical protein
VFLVNSRFPLVSAAPSSSGREVRHPTEALLLPKLRRHFAEFLNHRSPDRLGILYLPTCVGLGYGRRASSLAAFLGSMESVTSPCAARYHVSGLMGPGFTWSPPYTLTPGQPSPGLTCPPASPRRLRPSGGSVRLRRDSPLATRDQHGRGHGGTGISTGCASTTPVGLVLAPDSPWVDWPSPGTLGHSAEGVLTPLSLLMPAFSLDHGPRRFTPPLRSEIDAPLPPLLAQRPAASALDLSPVTLSAQDHSTSELLRTLSRVAASKPTSWLSGQSHIVYHLVQN